MDPIRKWLSAVAGPRQREFLIILGLATMQGFVWTMMIPVVPLLARDMGATGIQLGAITAIPALTAILSSIPGNALGMRYGKRTLFIWSQFAGLIYGALLLLTRRLGFMVAPQIIFGLSNMLFWPTQSAYLTEVIAPEIRAKAMGYAMAVSALGSILSPSLAGYIIDHGGYKPVFVLYMAMALTGLLIARTLPTLPSYYAGSVAGTIMAGYSGVGSMLKRPILQVTTLNTFLQFVTITTTESFIPAFMRGAGYSATFIGAMVTLRTAAMTGVRLFMGRLVGWFGTVPLLFAGVFACAVGGLIPAFPNPAFICASSILVGAGFGVSPVLTLELIAENTSPGERGMGMALDSTALGIGRTATGFGFGGIAQIVGFGPATVIANCFVVAGSLVSVSWYGRLRRKMTGLV